MTTASSSLGVERVEHAVGTWHEQQTALCRQQACEREVLVLDLPRDFPGDRVTSRDVSERLLVPGRGGPRSRSRQGRACRCRHPGCRSHHFLVGTELLADLVVEPGIGIVAAGIPADGAVDRRAQCLVHALLELAPADQLSGLRVDVLDEVRRLPRCQTFSIFNFSPLTSRL